MPGLTPCPGQRAGTTVYVDEDGHIYARRSESGRVRYMYCKTPGCPAHGRDDLGNFEADVPHAPFCRPNRQLILMNRMKEEMRRLARETGRVEESFRVVERREE